MANLPTVRAVAFYLSGKRAATISESSCSEDFGRQPLVGAIEGFAGMTKGISTLHVEVTGYVPTSGSAGNEIRKKAQAQEDIQIGLKVGSQFLRQTVGCVGIRTQSNTQTGMTQEVLVFQGPMPVMTENQG